jgi:hypothetical protein
MPAPLPDEILQKIDDVAESYHRLVIVAGLSASGKTAAMQEVARRTESPLVNVNLELSRRLLELTERRRALQVPRLLGEIISDTPGDVVLLDNIEILFDASLKQDPLRCLQTLSRNRTLVVAWNGDVTATDVQLSSLTFAIPGHTEYVQYPMRDLAVVTAAP